MSILSICPDDEVEGDDDEGEGKTHKQTDEHTDIQASILTYRQANIFGLWQISTMYTE